MKFQKSHISPRCIWTALIIFGGAVLSNSWAEKINQSLDPVPLWGDHPHQRPACVKGIHLTSWYTGNKKGREKFEQLFAETELNTAVIDVKEVEGDVYLWDVKLGDEFDTYVPALSKPQAYLQYLKDRGIFTIARVVVFKDNKLATLKPEWAVKTSSPHPKAVEKGFEPNIWVDQFGHAWADPYNKSVWDYNIRVAEKAAEIGFQGIQFDYIRFPSDGNTKFCIYSQPHTSSSSVAAIAGFLKMAHKRLKPLGVEISIDTFGLAASYSDGLGIGQRIPDFLDYIDVLSPMMYPSHYGPGEYGIADPNSSPYEVVDRSMKDTMKLIKGSGVKVRPYLQDFSLGVKYTADHVRTQIEAVNDNGADEWLLWNPQCRYTRDALKSK